MAPVTLRLVAEGGQRLLQHGQELVNPVMGLRLTEAKLQAVHRLQRVGLLIDEDEQQLVFHLRQGTFDPTADLTLARLAFQGLVQRIDPGMGCGKGWQQARKLFVRQSGRGEQLSRSVFQSSVG